jgi:hypothetical protein
LSDVPAPESGMLMAKKFLPRWIGMVKF